MLLGILSDTHNQIARTQVAVELLRTAGAEALVHCGDLASGPVVVACSILRCWFVFGNHDADAVPELRQAAADSGVTCLDWGGVFKIHGQKIGVVHGHLTSDLRRVRDERPSYLLSGHSHLPHDFIEGGLRRINPGALHRASKLTVALLDLDCGALRWIEIPRS